MYSTPPPGAPSSYYQQPPTTAPGWQQPAPAGQAWPGSEYAPSAPPPAATTGSYYPGTYGYMQGGHATPPYQGGMEAAHWGSNYQHQHQPGVQGQVPSSVPPALPPRPPTSFDPSQTHAAVSHAPSWPPQGDQQASYYPQGQPSAPPGYQPPADYQQQWHQQPYTDPQYSSSHPPPPPPPLPPAYQSEIQQYQQQQQQQQASGWSTPAAYQEPHPAYQHGFPPHPSQYGSPPPQAPITSPPAAPARVDTGNQFHKPPSDVTYDYPPPPPKSTKPSGEKSPKTVSPITSSAAPENKKVVSAAPGASALGAGGPSDWEHLATPGKDVDDAAAFNSKESNQQSSPFELSPEPKISAAAQSSEPQAGTENAQRTDTPSAQSRQGSIPLRSPASGQTASKRADSVASSVVSSDNIIDGVIDIWSRQAPSEVKPLSQASQPKERAHGSIASSSGEPPRTSTPASSLIQLTPQQSPRAATSKLEAAAPQSVTTIVDPYEDLDPWYKSSLTRYVTMLRKEMQTESEAEKFKIFSAFVSKESKLREILYNIEPEPDVATQKGGPSAQAETAAPSDEDDIQVEVPSPVHDDVLTYSPGGRPVFASAQSRNQKSQNPTTNSLHRSTSNPAPQKEQQQSGENPPSLELPGVEPRPNHLRSVSVPPEPAAPASGNTRPVYTPFRYMEGPQRGSEPLKFDRPAHQAYSALRLASAESGRVMSHAAGQGAQGSSVDASSRARGEHEFIGLVREKSVAYGLHRPTQSVSPRPSTADPLKRGIANAIFDELRNLTPSYIPNPSEAAPIATVKQELDKYPDEFGFVSKSLAAWDRGADSRQEIIDKQRRRRQEESEHHIDALFNDKEIGYSDINVLEQEFKQTEAQKQLNEERKEFDKFVEIVFTRVDERLESEISVLRKHFNQALKLLESDKQTESKLPAFQLSHAMRNAVDAFQKIELRYDKQVEVVLERERRRKKAERRYFVCLGESAALKNMDKEFDNVEKRILLDAAKSKDERVNGLMDCLDEASMKGLGENQRLLDDISSKIEKLDEGLINNMDGGSQGAQQTLRNTLEFVKFLGVDSEAILQSFGVADRLLNNADYGVSVSEAKMANSNADIFRRLEEEKKKEDKKIEEELQSRLGGIRKDHQDIIARVQKIFDITKGANGKPSSQPAAATPQPVSQTPAPPSHSLPEPVMPQRSPPPAPSAPSAPVSAEEERKERLRKALEDAKKRNASRVIPE